MVLPQGSLHVLARVSLSAGMLALVAALAPAPATGSACAPGDAICAQLGQAQGQAQDTQQQLNQIENRIADVQAKMRALATFISSLDHDIAGQQAQIHDSQLQLAALDARIHQTEADLAAREAQLQVREALFGQRVREMDKHDQVDYAGILLSASSFTDLVDRVLLMQQLITSDHRFIDELRAERAAVERVRDELQAQRTAAATLLAEQQVEEQQLEQKRAAQQAAYAYQAKLEQQYSAQRHQLELQQAQITAQVAGLQAAYQAELAAIAARERQQQQQQQASGGGSSGGGSSAGGSSAGGSAGAGQFIWPQASHLITQPFGCTEVLLEPYWPSCPTRHFHTGIDIAGPDGTPIYAAAAGVATDYPGSIGYGNYVIIVHPGGYATVYAHLSGLAVGSGAVVAQGQVIGYEGSTGYSTGPHLHFEIRYNDAYQDPCAYVGC